MFNLITTIIMGAICGSIAGNIMKTGFTLFGSDMIGNIVLGVIGSFVGSFLFGLLGLSVTGLIGSILCGVLGSCVVIWIAKQAKNK